MGKVFGEGQPAEWIFLRDGQEHEWAGHMTRGGEGSTATHLLLWVILACSEAQDGVNSLPLALLHDILLVVLTAGR